MPSPARPSWLPIAVAALLLAAGPAGADSFQSWAAKARKAQARRDDESALQAWSNALHLWKVPDGRAKKASALAERADLYQKKGDWEAALTDLSAALKLQSKDARLFHRRGVLRLEHGKPSEAISDFYRATALKLDYGEAFFDRARAYESQGDAAFAREDFRTACHLGFRKACGQAGPVAPGVKPRAEPKAKPAPAAAPAVAASTSATEAPAEIPVGSSVETIRAVPAPAPAAPPDLRACRNRVDACSNDGDSYGVCVSRARICEKDPRQGCCPRACLRLFQKLVETRSEAQAFREAFRPRSPCLSSQPTAPAVELEEQSP